MVNFSSPEGHTFFTHYRPINWLQNQNKSQIHNAIHETPDYLANVDFTEYYYRRATVVKS